MMELAPEEVPPIYSIKFQPAMPCDSVPEDREKIGVKRARVSFDHQSIA